MGLLPCVSVKLTPIEPRVTLPLAISWLYTPIAVLDGSAKPTPSFPRPPVMIAVLMPITCPAMFTSGPPEFPGIDGRIGLNKSLELLAHIAAILGADDSGGHAALQESKRIADRKSPVAYLNAVGIAELGSGQIVSNVNFDDGQIGLFVRADHLGGVGRRVSVKGHLNLRRLIHNVIIRQDIALLVDDHSGTQAALGRRSLIREIKKSIEEILEWLLLLVLSLTLTWSAGPDYPGLGRTICGHAARRALFTRDAR